LVLRRDVYLFRKGEPIENGWLPASSVSLREALWHL
jgi:hypothetical protein